MTTITLTGTRVDFSYDDPVAVGTDEIILTVPSASSTFSYTITGYDDEGLPEIDVNEDLYQAIIAGTNLADLEQFTDVDATVVTVQWAGKTSTIFALTWEASPTSNVDLYFVLDGAPLPDVSSASGWEAFDATITAVGAATGSYGPGQNIRWTDIAGFAVTEEDDFWGTAGRDIFDGGKGDDYFNSSDGRDVYKGGAGIDQVSFRNDPNGVTANLANGFAIDGWGNRDKLVSIEMLRGSMHDDTLIGTTGRQIFRGLAGDDTIKGGKGTDQVRYDIDSRYGGNAGVTVSLKKGTATDGFGDTDTLVSIEDVRGSASADRITGSNGKNMLEGEDGNDKLFGLGGNDVLEGDKGRDKLDGGNGDDVLTGGGQADLFIFTGDFGNDTITDFQTGGTKEKIDLSDITSIVSFNDLKKHHTTNVDGHAVIDDGAGNTITLDGVLKGDLSANDFIF